MEIDSVQSLEDYLIEDVATTVYDDDNDDDDSYCYSEELINVRACLLIGGSVKARTTTVNGMSIRRWLGLFIYRARVFAKHEDRPFASVMPIKTAWRDVKHVGPAFKGRRVSGFRGEEVPIELSFESWVPKGFIGLSAFGAPKILKRIMRCGIDSIADIDQQGSYMAVQDERLNTPKVQCPLLRDVLHNLSDDRENVSSVTGCSPDNAKSLFIVLQHGGGLKSWQDECATPVLKNLPKRYFDLAKEFRLSRTFFVSTNFLKKTIFFLLLFVSKQYVRSGH